jgi:hypothetical protein
MLVNFDPNFGTNIKKYVLPFLFNMVNILTQVIVDGYPYSFTNKF